MNNSDSENFLTRLNNFALVRFLLFAACGWTIVQLIAYFQAVIVIFTFAAILAFLLSYPVQWLKRFIPHSVAVISIYLVSIVILGSLAIAAGLGLLSQGQQLIDSVATFLNSLIPLVEQLEETLRNRNLQIDLSSVEEVLREQAISRLITILNLFQAFITNFATFIFIAVIAFFMLLEGEQLWIFILKIIPKPRRKRFEKIIKRAFLGFFRGQLLLTLFLTVTTFIVFVILKVPFPLVLSVIVGIIDVIPGIGATLGIGVITKGRQRAEGRRE